MRRKERALPRGSAPRSFMPEFLQRETRIAVLLLWLLPALWAINYVVARKAPRVIGPHTLARSCWSLAALILLVITLLELRRERELVIRGHSAFEVIS